MTEVRLDGRRALLLGAASPLATEVAVRLADAGARVVRPGSGGTAGDAAGPGDAATSDPADPATAVGDAAARLGGLDILIHLARPSVSRPFLDRSDAAWSADLEGRIGAPIRVARAAAQAMRAKGGSLVFVGTLDAVHAYHGHADASVAMGALTGLVRTLAVELAPLGVRANSVLVGPVEDGVPGADPGLVERTRLRSPSGRFVTPAEAAAAIVFVAGPGAAFMSGASLRVDGGWASLNQAPDGMRFR